MTHLDGRDQIDLGDNPFHHAGCCAHRKPLEKEREHVEDFRGWGVPLDHEWGELDLRYTGECVCACVCERERGGFFSHFMAPRLAGRWECTYLNGLGSE